ncbi:hypothetical protein Tco_0109310 [Tanacetum coccineum]
MTSITIRSRNIESSSNSEGITTIVNKLENLGRDIKKLKENVHTIQVGCQTCEGAHLDKDCPLKEEVKGMEEVKYGEFSRPFPNNIYDASKRQANQDEWLKKFYQSIKSSRETHDKIIQGLEGKVKTLANEVEGRSNNKKFEECKTIYSENGFLLYTPFYYSPEEIEYFYANSGFSDNEEQETDDSVAALEATLKKKREEPKKVKQNVNYYVDPYEPLIPFPKRLEHHAEEALVHQTMDSLKKIKINRHLLKEIRQTDNYAKKMKYLVENKPRTEEDNEIRMNPRMPIILRRPLLATAHAQVDIFRNTISLEVGSEKVIFKMRISFTTTNFESVSSLKSETFVEDDNHKEIDYDLFLYDSESWQFCKKRRTRVNIGHLEINNDSKREELEWENLSINDLMRIRYGKICKMTGERILKDYWRERFRDEEDDLEEYLEDPKECGEDKVNTILGVMHDKLNNDWFNTSEYEDDLEGILDYLKPRSYDGFIDLDDEAYNKRRCRLLGMTYEEPTLILIEKAKVTRYIVGPGETYTKVKVLGVKKIPRTRDNVAAMRARLMKKMAQEGNN